MLFEVKGHHLPDYSPQDIHCTALNSLVSSPDHTPSSMRAKVWSGDKPFYGSAESDNASKNHWFTSSHKVVQSISVIWDETMNSLAYRPQWGG